MTVRCSSGSHRRLIPYQLIEVCRAFFLLLILLSFFLVQPYQHNQQFCSTLLFQTKKLDNLNYIGTDCVVDPYLVPMKEYPLEFFYGEQEQ